MLDLSFRHYRAGAALIHWHRNGELPHTGNPDKDIDEKAARKIAKYRELHLPGTIAVSWISCRPSPALQAAFIASCCACCSYTRTGRRHASLRFSTTSTRNHTHLGSLIAALLSSLSRARQVSLSRGLRCSGQTISTAGGHEYHGFHASPPLCSNAHFLRLPFEL